MRPGPSGRFWACCTSGKVPKDQEGKVQERVAALGGPEELGAVLDLVIRGDAMPGPRRAALLEVLAQASRRRKVVPAGDPARIVPMLTGADATLRAAALRAASAWDVPAIRGRLADLAGAADTPAPVRAAAIEAMAAGGRAEGRRAIEALADRGADPGIQALALSALEELDPNAAAPRIAAWLGRLPVDAHDQARRVLSAVLGRRGGSAILARAMDQAKIAMTPDLAKLAIRQARGTGRDESALIAALSRAGKLDAAPKALAPAEMAAIVADVAGAGDPARGEAVFRRKLT